MTPEDAFLDDIRENPDDDTPRLIFADWLEDNGDPQRAEFVRTQIQLFRLALDSVAKAELRARSELLLQANWDKWAAPLGRIIGSGTAVYNWPQRGYQAAILTRFPRGFLEEVELDSERLVQHVDALFRRYPIRHFHLHRAGEQARRLACCPYLAWVETIIFSDYYRAPLDAAGMARLADSDLFQRLWMLGLYNNHVGEEGTIALARAHWLPRIAWLVLDENGVSYRGIEALARTPLEFRPVRLSLSGNGIGERGGVALANSRILHETRTLVLRGCSLGPATAIALSRSPFLDRLEELDLTGNDIGAQGRLALEESPWRQRLRILRL